MIQISEFYLNKNTNVWLRIQIFPYPKYKNPKEVLIQISEANKNPKSLERILQIRMSFLSEITKRIRIWTKQAVHISTLV